MGKYRREYRGLYNKSIHTEEALKQARDQAQLYLQAAQVIMLVLDPGGAITLINQKGMETLGYGSDELTGRNWFDVCIPEGNRDDVKYAFQKLITGEAEPVSYYEIQIQTKKKEKRLIAFHNIILRDRESRIVGMLSSGEDVTETRQTEEALRQSEDRYKRLSEELEQRVNQRTVQIQITNEELESVIYSISHDLYSPLRGISGYTGILMEKSRQNVWDGDARALPARIWRIASRMEQMVNAVRFLLGLLKKEFKNEDISLSAMINAIAEDYKKRAPERKGEFIIQPGVHVCADLDTMETALRALIDNAWQYTAWGNYYRIEFGVMEEAGNDIFFIRDNGRGFDQKYADQLFRPFYRLEAYPTGESGFGIGLTVAHAIVRKQLGSIWAESEEGKGATFYFTLGGNETCEEVPVKAV